MSHVEPHAMEGLLLTNAPEAGEFLAAIGIGPPSFWWEVLKDLHDVILDPVRKATYGAAIAEVNQIRRLSHGMDQAIVGIQDKALGQTQLAVHTAVQSTAIASGRKKSSLAGVEGALLGVASNAASAILLRGVISESSRAVLCEVICPHLDLVVDLLDSYQSAKFELAGLADDSAAYAVFRQHPGFPGASRDTQSFDRYLESLERPARGDMFGGCLFYLFAFPVLVFMIAAILGMAIGLVGTNSVVDMGLFFRAIAAAAVAVDVFVFWWVKVRRRPT
jgi:hypothetical protein